MSKEKGRSKKELTPEEIALLAVEIVGMIRDKTRGCLDEGRTQLQVLNIVATLLYGPDAAFIRDLQYFVIALQTGAR